MVLTRLGLPQDAKDGGGDDPEGALAPDEGAPQIEARGIGILAPQPDDLAVGKDHLEAQHVVGGDPVLEAVRPARVLGDVAAHRGSLQAGRIGGVVEAVGGERRGDVQR